MSESKITVDNVTIEALNEVKYGDLLQTLTDLGVKDCWKPGTQRVVMVQNAIEKLAVIKSMKQDGKSDEEIQKSLDAKADAKEDVKKAEELKVAEQEEAKAKETVEEVKTKKMTKETVERCLAGIEKNLKNGIPAQRPILLKKKEALLKIQETEDYYVEELSDEEE